MISTVHPVFVQPVFVQSFLSNPFRSILFDQVWLGLDESRLNRNELDEKQIYRLCGLYLYQIVHSIIRRSTASYLFEGHIELVKRNIKLSSRGRDRTIRSQKIVGAYRKCAHGSQGVGEAKKKKFFIFLLGPAKKKYKIDHISKN